MKKILIIDNSQLIINVLLDLFSENNTYTINVAKSLSEVEKMLLSNNYFLAISNMVLPDALNGELLYTLKSANIPTLILSSKIDEKTIDEIKKFEVIDYILKDSINGLKTVVNLAELFFYIKGKKVLVVEDSLFFSSQIKTLLISLFLKVVVVENGEEALSYLKNNDDVSLIISDYNMPKLNGLELTYKIRKEKYQTELPIILISSEYNDNLKIKSYKYGVNDFLQKPLLLEELKAKVIDIFSQLYKINKIETYNKMFDDHVIASVTNNRGIIKWVSNAFCHISGYSKDELIGKSHNIVRHPDMPNSIYDELWSTIKQGKIWKGEIKNLRKDGTSYWVSSTIEPEFDNFGKVIAFHSVRQDITDKKLIYELSIRDGLTGLYNRRFFNEMSEEQLHKTVRIDDIFSFIVMDVDNFKKYNDTYGHQMGDIVLKEISKTLTEVFKRSDDFVFRLGGEEFGIIIHTKNLDDAINLVTTAKNEVQNLAIEHEKNIPYNCITISFGLVSITSKKVNEFDIEELYKLADDKLYEAKQKGRNALEYIEV